jgi:hypothetical protein
MLISIAIQHHRPKREQTQLPDGRRTTQDRTRKQTGLSSHEMDLSYWRRLSPRCISGVRLLDDFLQLPRIRTCCHQLILDLLGSGHPGNNCHCGGLVCLGEEERSEV